MGSRHRLAFSLLPLLVFSLLPFTVLSGIGADRAALLALRSAVGPAILASWDASASPCSYHGVKCDGSGRGRVTALRLPGSSLIGRIPAGTLGGLTALQTLSLRFNALSGLLPSDLGNCTQLRHLYLQNNRFSGELPPSVFMLKKLVRLDLGGNNFSGEISLGFKKLKRLETLYLDNNSFTGEIPDLELPNLAQFNVSFNNLNGSVPKSLQKMRKDSFLGLSVCGGPLRACPGKSLPPPASDVPAVAAVVRGGGKKKLSGGAIAGISIASVVAFLIFLFTVVCLSRRLCGPENRTGPGKQPEGLVTAGTEDKVAGSRASGKKLVFFRGGEFEMEDLLKASAEVLGKGSYGTTYRATMESGAVLAVKRVKDVRMSEREFKEKIEAIAALEHRNLVPLKAYYFSNDEKLLVYDFMPSGSLSALLHGNRGSGRTPLNWEARSLIALSSARGLAYIHSTSPTSSHGNIKSSNVVLFNSHSNARVSDHGLHQLVGPTTGTSSHARGSGYHAPEITDPRKISQKADVYSFGVLLLELLTGKSPAHAFNDEGVDLPRWVQSVLKDRRSSEVFDSELVRHENVGEKMMQLLQLGIDCAALVPERRPSMPEVVARIEGIFGVSRQMRDSIEES